MKRSTKSATRKQRPHERKRAAREPSAENATTTADNGETADVVSCPSCGVIVTPEYATKCKCDACGVRWCAKKTCRAVLDPSSPYRCKKCGCVQHANPYTAVHWLRSDLARRDGPADVQAIRTAVDDFRARIVADQGGADALTGIHDGYINRLCEAESLCRLIGRDLAARGCFTPRGRMRGTFAAFISAVTVWDRIGQRLGMARRTKDIDDLDCSVEEYARRQEERERQRIERGRDTSTHEDSNDRERIDVRDERPSERSEGERERDTHE